MKKFLVILLLLTYGFSSTGMTVNLHYCCGKLKKVDWAPPKEKDCGSQHKMGSKPCCETKQITSKQKGEQEQAQCFAKQVKPLSDFIRPSSELTIEKPISRRLSPVAFAPPPLALPPLFILHCVYRI